MKEGTFVPIATPMETVLLPTNDNDEPEPDDGEFVWPIVGHVPATEVYGGAYGMIPVVIDERGWLSPIDEDLENPYVPGRGLLLKKVRPRSSPET